MDSSRYRPRQSNSKLLGDIVVEIENEVVPKNQNKDETCFLQVLDSEPEWIDCPRSVICHTEILGPPSFDLHMALSVEVLRIKYQTGRVA